MAACGALGSSGERVTDHPVPGAGGPRSDATVTRIVDGDTIHVDLDGRVTTIRIIGIDTPEMDGPYTDEECFGQEATRYTEQALAGREVELEFDVDRTDRYDRTLAYVWVGNELFDERILEDGYAVLLTVPPNVRYVDRLTQAQRAGREAGAGLWGACPRRLSPVEHAPRPFDRPCIRRPRDRSVDDDRPDPLREGVRSIEVGPVLHGDWVEQHQVGDRALLDAAALRQPETIGRQRGHLADGGLQGQHTRRVRSAQGPGGRFRSCGGGRVARRAAPSATSTTRRKPP